MTQDQFNEMIQSLTESKILGNSMNAGMKRNTQKKNQKK